MRFLENKNSPPLPPSLPIVGVLFSSEIFTLGKHDLQINTLEFCAQCFPKNKSSQKKKNWLFPAPLKPILANLP